MEFGECGARIADKKSGAEPLSSNPQMYHMEILVQELPKVETRPRRGLSFDGAYAPQTGSDVEWNAAFYRLEDYFRSLQLESKVQQSQLILQILETAAHRHELNPELSPTTLVMEEAYAWIDRWFEIVLQKEDPFSREGRLALLSTDAMVRWPKVFLSENPPSDYRRTLQQSNVQAGPDLQVSSMVPRPLDDSPLLEFELPKPFRKLVAFTMTFAIFITVILALLFFA